MMALGMVIIASIAQAQAQAPVVYGDPPVAQSDRPDAVISDPLTIERCLCSDRNVSSLAETLALAKSRYQTAQSRAAALSRQTKALHDRIDPQQSESLDAYRRLVEASEQATHNLYHVAQPDYAAAATQYNAAVTSYNGDCAGKRFAPEISARVKSELVCTAP